MFQLHIDTTTLTYHSFNNAIYVNLLKHVMLQPGYYCMGMQPVVDGPGGVLPDMPLALREAGQVNPANEMIGFTSDDASIFLAWG